MLFLAVGTPGLTRSSATLVQAVGLWWVLAILGGVPGSANPPVRLDALLCYGMHLLWAVCFGKSSTHGLPVGKVIYQVLGEKEEALERAPYRAPF